MHKDVATRVFESLASGIRLDVWRLLVKAGLEGRVAGELAGELDIAPNSLSFHLKALLHAAALSRQYPPDARFDRLSHRGVLCRSPRSLWRDAGRIRLLAPCIARAILLQ